MASITGWTRLEPRPRSKNFDRALEARVRDATWLLARQWQVGEFQADDAGSAISARLELGIAPINRYQGANDASPKPYDRAQLPLETLVEHEVVLTDGGTDLRQAAEAGLYFMRLLRDRDLETRYRNEYLARYPLVAPPGIDTASGRFLAVMQGRAPDGMALMSDLNEALQDDPTTLPMLPEIDAADGDAVLAAAAEWLDWLATLYLEPADGRTAWVPERFEYQFRVSAPSDTGEVVLAAREYHGGHLDWHAFDVVEDAALGGDAGPGVVETVEHVVVPTAIDFDGMPAERWWEFEDGHVNFARVDAAAEDLARLLMLEFALVYGNDWLMIPARVPVGSLCQVRSFVVTDTFGEQVEVPASAQPDEQDATWGMFYLGTQGRSLAHRRDPAEHYFFLPPSLGASLEGEPHEEVVLIRDEMANLAWAIERKVPGASGRPIDRFEQYQESQRLAPPTRRTPVDGAEVAYNLASLVPDHWIPLVPVRVGDDGRSIALQRGAMLDPTTGGGILPLGRFLTPGERLIIEDEEVPRTGVRATRNFQRTRWTRGSSLLWMARKKTAGRGEGSSGLRFDSI